MFSTLLGPLPAAPDATAHADDAADLHARVENVVALEAAGLELVTDGTAPLGPGVEPAEHVARWTAVAAAAAAPVKHVLLGPWSSARARGENAEAEADRLRPTILALAAAGCPLVEIAEPDAGSIVTKPTDALAFAAAHRRLIDGTEGIHASLAVTGGNVDGAGASTFFDLGYASYAFDLIAGPDNWRLIVEAPADRGIVCGAIGLAPGADATREVLVWAAHYAASTRGRGLARVGLANAPVAPGAPQPARAEVLRRLALVAEASRMAAVEEPRELAALLDRRAVDPRSSAGGRFAPARRRRSP